jgi:xanthosine utilization system XapX-like protein
MMRYYLTFVMLGLLMGGLCLLLEVHTAAPSVAMTGLFGASAAPAPVEGAALPA